ncbi:hypothetical protein AVEN_192738-1 [Araneus ventricosus]|uniref:Uncharacterized protein n=1 Tax=Araneus ventricosus TaxID=182803 RepID=A0A4Y2KPG4_ARAVE|nr:hypothetical protein AVEN_192738-1 [Araneus ventricosus]
MKINTPWRRSSIQKRFRINGICTRIRILKSVQQVRVWRPLRRDDSERKDASVELCILFALGPYCCFPAALFYLLLCK